MISMARLSLFDSTVARTMRLAGANAMLGVTRRLTRCAAKVGSADIPRNTRTRTFTFMATRGANLKPCQERAAAAGVRHAATVLAFAAVVAGPASATPAAQQPQI